MYSFLDYFEEVGLEKGIEKGREEERMRIYCRMFRNNRTPEDISDFTGESVDYLYGLQEKYMAMLREESHYDSGKTGDVLTEES